MYINLVNLQYVPIAYTVKQGDCAMYIAVVTQLQREKLALKIAELSQEKK